jgi:uncharacterized membrane protein
MFFRHKRKRKEADSITRANIQAITQMDQALDQNRTFGERVADGFAAVVGSWPFIIVQSLLLLVWVALNLAAWRMRWDPYPFILLNLALSFQAAYASPIIMMSQNRQNRIADRRNQLDLQINLLAEQESTETLRLLRRVCEKMGIDADEGGRLKALEQATRPDRLARQIDHARGTQGPTPASSPPEHPVS